MRRLGFYHPPSGADKASLGKGMNKMRNFILCSAAILCGWLTVSYQYHPDANTAGKLPTQAADQTGAVSAGSEDSAEKVPASNPQDRLATMSSLKGQ